MELGNIKYFEEDITKLYYCNDCGKYFNSLVDGHVHAEKHTPFYSLGNVKKLNKYIDEKYIMPVDLIEEGDEQ